jgi:hypothetical protein
MRTEFSVPPAPSAIIWLPWLHANARRREVRGLPDLALADGMPEGEPPRLPEVKAALRLLNIEWSPDPVAPAMPIPQFEQHELCLAA